MKHKLYVEEYIPIVNILEDFPTVEPTERDEYIPPMPTPPAPAPPNLPTTLSYSPSVCPTHSMDYSFRPYNTITSMPSKTSGIYSYAPFSYEYKTAPPIPPINNTDNPSTSPMNETYKPTCVLTYSPSKDIVANNTIGFYKNDKYNTIVFGMATGLGSLCFFVICAYVYKIYASKKHKLQKIQKNALKREYESLNDIHITDYNSQF
jgi:hypothetical protein